MSYSFMYFFDAIAFENPPILNMFVDYASFPDSAKSGDSKTDELGAWH